MITRGAFLFSANVHVKVTRFGGQPKKGCNPEGSDTIDTELALGALQMAVKTRCPRPALVHHTDRDCRYASDDYQAALRANSIVTSMSRKGDCWDNSAAERFFATLEKELLDLEPLRRRSETREAVADYIEHYYNSARRHSYVSYHTPLEHEMMAS